MAPLGPWGRDRAVAVALSGGADSLCLTWLAARWGRVHALVIDHGLRPDSAAEARDALARAARFGVTGDVRRITLAPGSGISARARAARYAALLAMCAERGLTDLLVGHHVGDQAETVAMRRLGGSLARGRAAMAAVTIRPEARIVRPLLAVTPHRLRATLRAAGHGWIEDPTNRDPRWLRTRLRARLTDPDVGADDAARLWSIAFDAGQTRAADDESTAAMLAEWVRFYPQGYAVVGAEQLPAQALSAVIGLIAGRVHPPSPGSVESLARRIRPATVAGAQIRRAGRLGPGWLVVREAAAMQPPQRAAVGTVWDGRFRIRAIAGDVDGLTIGPLGPDAALFRSRAGLPSIILRSLPAIRLNDGLFAVPHLDYHLEQTGELTALGPAPPIPAAGAPFWAVGRNGDAQWVRAPHFSIC